MLKNKKVWKQKFSLRKGGAPRLEFFSEEGEWKNVSVRFDGKEVGKIANKKILHQGVDFNLEDGSKLSVKQKTANIFDIELDIRINGEPIPGSESDPERKLASASSVLFALAILNFINIVILLLQGFGSIALVILGIVYISIYSILGFCVMSKSKIALKLALVLYIIDNILYVWNSLEAKSQQPLSSLLDGSSQFDSQMLVGITMVRVSFWLTMYGGLKAINDLKRRSS
jgi:hypothetical protein